MNRADANSSPVFFFDVDNTLLDNDRVSEDLKRYLTDKVGAPSAQRYWELFEQLRTELGYADYLGALQRYRVERPRDPKLLAVSHFMVNYPFANRLFPESLDAVEYTKRFGRAVILSDGDVVFQPRKVDRSGLFEIFEGTRPDLYPQRAGTGRCRGEVSRAALCNGGRQSAHSGSNQEALGRKSDHHLSAPGTLRAGCGAGCEISQARHHAGTDR